VFNVGDIVKLKDNVFETLSTDFMGGREKRFIILKLFINNPSVGEFIDMAELKYTDSEKSFAMPTEHLEKEAGGGGKRRKKYSKKKKKSKSKRSRKSKRKRSKTRRRR